MTIPGLMMEQPLLISSLLAYGAANHGDSEIVTRSVEGPIHRTTYAETYARTQRLANALMGLGIEPGDRVATLAWNTHRHMELYYAVSGLGAVCHTINPRLFRDQITYIVGHAGDRVIFADLTFVPLLEALWDELDTPEAVVVMTDAAHMPETSLPRALCYEDLLAEAPEGFDWPTFDEGAASALCYTSGTTGEPKGALYSHRSTVLHALAFIALFDGRVTSRDTILMIVPMFHVCGWGLPYMAPITGIRIVFPGPGYDGESLHELFEAEKVTVSAGVPTVLLGLLDHLRETGKSLPHAKVLVNGGSAPSPAMIEEIESLGIEFVQGWGMTETSPVGAIGALKPAMADLPHEARQAQKLKQGRPPLGCEIKIVDEEGRRLPHDGEAAGEVCLRGNWIIERYFENEAASAAAFDAEGWLRSGDIGTIDRDGYLHLTDRAKDLIKSGGEWISSIDLEAAAMGHPDVAQAAAIALPHPKWSERPLLVVIPREGAEMDKTEILSFLSDKVAKWWLPDDVVFVDALPLTATGKVSKARLRAQFKDHVLPTV
jgi:fatty-acyl-CoA synthase